MRRLLEDGRTDGTRSRGWSLCEQVAQDLLDLRRRRRTRSSEAQASSRRDRWMWKAVGPRRQARQHGWSLVSSMRRYLSTRSSTPQRCSYGKRSPLLLDVSSANSHALLDSTVVDVPPLGALSNDDRSFYLPFSTDSLGFHSRKSLLQRSRPSHFFPLQIHLPATQPSRSDQHLRHFQPYHLPPSRIPQDCYSSTSIHPLNQLLGGSSTPLPLSNPLQRVHRLAQLERMAQPATHRLKRRSRQRCKWRTSESC